MHSPWRCCRKSAPYRTSSTSTPSPQFFASSPSTLAAWSSSRNSPNSDRPQGVQPCPSAILCPLANLMPHHMPFHSFSFFLLYCLLSYIDLHCIMFFHLVSYPTILFFNHIVLYFSVYCIFFLFIFICICDTTGVV